MRAAKAGVISDVLEVKPGSGSGVTVELTEMLLVEVALLVEVGMAALV